MPITVEATRYSVLVRCTSCGARFVAARQGPALTEAAAHERAAHPAEHDARRRAGRPRV